VRQVLEEIGLEGERVRMINISSAMGGQFAIAATKITDEIRQLGPNPLKEKSKRASIICRRHDNDRS
jgi:coenzyme F420-reducing hydrogenase delta subunit